ncbi:MAG TPA: cytochrome c [Gammaproteobacteria bacterium]|nr:cytochrome c [Gammaproteobacteria bacterium]
MNTGRPLLLPAGYPAVIRRLIATAICLPLALPALSAADDSGLPPAQLYLQSCAACHGVDGAGAMPGVPDLSAASGPLTKPIDALLALVQKGIPARDGMGMPPKGGNPDLTEAQLRAILQYMKHEFAR